MQYPDETPMEAALEDIVAFTVDRLHEAFAEEYGNDVVMYLRGNASERAFLKAILKNHFERLAQRAQKNGNGAWQAKRKPIGSPQQQGPEKEHKHSATSEPESKTSCDSSTPNGKPPNGGDTSGKSK